MRRAAILLALFVAACGSEERPGYDVRVDGERLVLDGPQPLRAVRIDLAWDEGSPAPEITPGEAAARMNLFRAAVDEEARTARILISDWRKLRLPVRGELARVGGATVRVTEVEVAE